MLMSRRVECDILLLCVCGLCRHGAPLVAACGRGWVLWRGGDDGGGLPSATPVRQPGTTPRTPILQVTENTTHTQGAHACRHRGGRLLCGCGVRAPDSLCVLYVYGMCVVRYESRDQSKSGPSGTEVDVQAIKTLVQQAIHALPT